MLRAAVSNSFRAPSLSQIGFSQTVSNYGEGGELVDVETLPVSDPLARALGAEDLDAEESVNFSVGLTAQLGEQVTLTVDTYQIDVDDRITLSEQFNRPFPDPAEQIAGDTAAVNFFTNAVDTRTRGIDIVTTWTASLGAGVNTLTAAYNYSATDITERHRTANQPPGFELVGVEETNTLTDAIPRDKFVLSDNWAAAHWTVGGRLIRYGDVVRVFAFFPAGANEYGREWQLDADIEYAFNDSISINFGASNLLDEYPDRQDDNYNAAGNFPYDVITPIGFNGRHVYAGVRFATP
jgi:iron complex outermembrane receptor protein